jgi:peroxiredoxin
MPGHLSYSIPYERKNIMKMTNTDIEVLAVSIGSTLDQDKGKYESGVLFVLLKDKEGTTVSAKLDCNITQLRERFKWERTYEKMLKLYGGDKSKLNNALKEMAKQ